MPISIPNKISVPWATSGLKNTIPAASDPLTGLAGYDQGFTAINMTPKTAGGIPPFGQDFNGAFFAVTEALRYLETGALFPYDGTFATAVGGYPLGSLLQRTDGYGLWRNTVADNTTDPEAFGAGWVPEGAGLTSVPMSNANVTLTALQAARNIVVITGTLTANLNLVFPTYQRQWLVVNAATGAFSVTAKTASGSGVAVSTGSIASVYGDGTNIASAAPVSFASNAEAQALSSNNKVISPATLAAAFQGANVSLTQNGYAKIPGGLIIQWGRNEDTGVAASFPMAFPNLCLVMTTADNQASYAATAATSAQIVSTSQFVVRQGAGASAGSFIFWIAIGY